MTATTRIFVHESQRVRFSAAEVWRVLADLSTWPEWWPDNLPLAIERRAETLRASVIRLSPRCAPDLTLRFDDCDERESLVLRTTGRGMDGPIYVRLEPHEEGTRVHVEMDVFARGFVAAIVGSVVSLDRFHARHVRRVLRHLNRRLKATHGDRSIAPPPRR